MTKYVWLHTSNFSIDHKHSQNLLWILDNDQTWRDYRNTMYSFITPEEFEDVMETQMSQINYAYFHKSSQSIICFVFSLGTS